MIAVCCTISCQSGIDLPGAIEQAQSREVQVVSPKSMAKQNETESQRSNQADPILQVGVPALDSVNSGQVQAPVFARINQPLAFDLALPGGKSWGEANIGRFIVRLADGSQHSLPRPSPRYREQSIYRPQVAGPAMFVLSTGPSQEENGRGQDSMESNTHFAKHIVQVVADGGNPGVEDLNFGISDRVGQLLELRPLMHIFGVPLHSLVPIKVYDHGKGQSGATVEVFKPNGEVERVQSNQAGIVNYRPDQYGSWLFRYRSQLGGQEYVAELSFTTTKRGLGK